MKIHASSLMNGMTAERRFIKNQDKNKFLQVEDILIMDYAL